MQLEAQVQGDYRIVARALHAPAHRGYIAAVVVQRVRGNTDAPRDAWREECLAGGYVWPSAQAARVFALAKGQEVIRHEAFRLSC
jgi:hypothetical protein